MDGVALTTDGGCGEVGECFLDAPHDGDGERVSRASLMVKAEAGDMRRSAMLMTFSVFLAPRVCADLGLCEQETLVSVKITQINTRFCKSD